MSPHFSPLAIASSLVYRIASGPTVRSLGYFATTINISPRHSSHKQTRLRTIQSMRIHSLYSQQRVNVIGTQEGYYRRSPCTSLSRLRLRGNKKIPCPRRGRLSTPISNATNGTGPSTSVIPPSLTCLATQAQNTSCFVVRHAAQYPEH